MNSVTQEWVDKAEGDWNALGREVRARKFPNFDDACFHAQQYAEKYLNARLVEANFVFPKTHDLLKLLALVLPIEPGWHALHPALSTLDLYSVLSRYPGFSATREQSKEARKHCETVRSAARLDINATFPFSACLTLYHASGECF